MQGKKRKATLKKELLNKVIGEVIKEKRAVKNKGILCLHTNMIFLQAR